MRALCRPGLYLCDSGVELDRSSGPRLVLYDGASCILGHISMPEPAMKILVTSALEFFITLCPEGSYEIFYRCL